MSLASKFSYETVELIDVSMGVNSGLDKVRFMNTVVVDSKVRPKYL